MRVKSCVRSGYCCKVAPCVYGEWCGNTGRCKFLQFTKGGLAKCSKYYEILKQPGSDISPAFGAGCSSSIGNERRIEIIVQYHNSIIPTHDV